MKKNATIKTIISGVPSVNGGNIEMRALSVCIREWLDNTKRLSVKPATFDRLETTYAALLKHPIASQLVHTLTTSDLQKYINALAADGYSLSTIKKHYHLVSAYIKYANGEGLMLRPIHNNVTLPAKSTMQSKRSVPTYTKPEEIALRKVLNTGKRLGYYAALLMLETGLRVGEALALTWDDVQWERSALNVNKTLIRIANRRKIEVQDSAKSHTSNRVIPLSKMAIEILEKVCERSDDPHGYIFAGDDGRPISYEAMRYQIQHACADAKVPYKGQHAFRHTFATNCYKRGADVKLLSKILGHCDVSITFNIYIHLYGDALEELRGIVG